MTTDTYEKKDVPLTRNEIERLNAGEEVPVMLDDGTDVVLHAEGDA